MNLLKKTLKLKIVFISLIIFLCLMIYSYMSSVMAAILGASQNKSKCSVSFTGNELVVYNFFKSKGYSDVMICAIMGNLQAESGLNPSAIQSKEKTITANGGIGLAQWTSKGRKEGFFTYVKSKSRMGSLEEWNNINYQLEYLFMETDPKAERGNYAALQWLITDQAKRNINFIDWSRNYSAEEQFDMFSKQTDVIKATQMFCWLHERPSETYSNIDKRQQYATNYLSQIHTRSNSNINYVKWAVDIATDNKHGYCQSHRDGNPDYDCSSLIFYALKNSGFNVGIAPFTTSDEPNILKNAGFKHYYLKDITPSGLKEGDILWVNGHTEIYIGGGKNVGAHIDSSGSINCLAGSGDQSGNEISVQSSNNTYWTYVFRKE